jgi:small subunit ribosomal protein S8
MYYDLLARIKNATMAGKEKMTVPFSKMDFAVAKALAEVGYLKSAEKEAAGKRNVIIIRLAYKDKKGVVNDFKMISKPSRHFYMDYRSIRPVKQGHGVGVLSTSKGIMTDKTARKEKVGGEYLFQIW